MSDCKICLDDKTLTYVSIKNISSQDKQITIEPVGHDKLYACLDGDPSATFINNVYKTCLFPGILCDGFINSVAIRVDNIQPGDLYEIIHRDTKDVLVSIITTETFSDTMLSEFAQAINETGSFTAEVLNNDGPPLQIKNVTDKGIPFIIKITGERNPQIIEYFSDYDGTEQNLSYKQIADNEIAVCLSAGNSCEGATNSCGIYPLDAGSYYSYELNGELIYTGVFYSNSNTTSQEALEPYGIFLEYLDTNGDLYSDPDGNDIRSGQFFNATNEMMKLTITCTDANDLEYEINTNNPTLKLNSIQADFCLSPEFSCSISGYTLEAPKTHYAVPLKTKGFIEFQEPGLNSDIQKIYLYPRYALDENGNALNSFLNLDDIVQSSFEGMYLQVNSETGDLWDYCITPVRILSVYVRQRVQWWTPSSSMTFPQVVINGITHDLQLDGDADISFDHDGTNESVAKRLRIYFNRLIPLLTALGLDASYSPVGGSYQSGVIRIRLTENDPEVSFKNSGNNSGHDLFMDSSYSDRCIVSVDENTIPNSPATISFIPHQRGTPLKHSIVFNHAAEDYIEDGINHINILKLLGVQEDIHIDCCYSVIAEPT